MKNLFTPSDIPGGAVLGFFAFAVAWSLYNYDIDWVQLFLLALSPLIYLFLRRWFTSKDPRLDKLADLAKDVAQGQVTGRLVHLGPTDKVGILCRNINNMLDQFETCFREQQTVMKMAMQGKYFRQAQPVGLRGIFRDAMQGSNHSLAIMAENARQEKLHQDAVSKAQQEISALVAAASKGYFDQRLSESGKSGFFLDLACHLNQLSTNLESALREAAETLRSVAQGDLTAELNQRQDGIFGELQQDTNDTVERLRGVISQIKQAADTIDTAASEIAQGNTDLAERTEAQASRLEETSAGMERLQTAVHANTATAQQVRDLANQAHEHAIRAGEQVQSVVASMEAMEQNSRKISDIIGLIDGIAFQTNILALNAAVEAARAGEQGRGFAVVAKEVRNLAQRSGDAAREIKTLISQSVATVHQGAERVRNAVGTVNAVVTSFQNVANLIREINSASEKQNIDISTLAGAVQAMDREVQQNAALVQQAGAAAESLEQQAQGLVTTIGVFRL